MLWERCRKRQRWQPPGGRLAYVAGVIRGRGNLGARECVGRPREKGTFPFSILPRAWSRALIPFTFPFERLPRRLGGRLANIIPDTFSCQHKKPCGIIRTPTHTAPESVTETYPICGDPFSRLVRYRLAPLQKPLWNHGSQVWTEACRILRISCQCMSYRM